MIPDKIKAKHTAWELCRYHHCTDPDCDHEEGQLDHCTDLDFRDGVVVLPGFTVKALRAAYDALKGPTTFDVPSDAVTFEVDLESGCIEIVMPDRSVGGTRDLGRFQAVACESDTTICKICYPC